EQRRLRRVEQEEAMVLGVVPRLLDLLQSLPLRALRDVLGRRPRHPGLQVRHLAFESARNQGLVPDPLTAQHEVADLDALRRVARHDLIVPTEATRTNGFRPTVAAPLRRAGR